MEREENGIKVYSSKLSNTNFKAVKVESVVEGDIDMLLSLLTTVDGMKGWVYKTENIKLINSSSDSAVTFYSETDLPWPMSNRDAIVHLEMNKNNLPDFSSIKGTCDPDGAPKEKGIVRISHFIANWRINMLKGNKMHIVYVVEVDPGGNIPAWINNMFIAKGPYETFINLEKKLKSINK
ncbi:MAG: hypothetical protein KJO64_03240 [Bacteroidia bacterium]|nr:hypothetical protein [Bacteroidia bacterium]